MSNSKKVLVISGSIRKDSTSLAISHSINEIIANWAITSDVLTCAKLPLFSEDLEKKRKPIIIGKIEEIIREATGIIICTPEYNASVPGGLKNFLDWFSRPHDGGAFRKKIVSVVVHTPFQKGGYGAYSDLLRILSHMGNYVHYHVQGRLFGFREKDGKLLKTTNEELCLLMEDYRNFFKKLKLGVDYVK